MVARLRIALDGAGTTLTDHAAAAGSTGSAARGARLTRLGESLTPTLRDLVLKVLIDRVRRTQPSAARTPSSARATGPPGCSRTGPARCARTECCPGPPFATASVPEAPYAGEDDLAEIREAVKYDPAQMMWQLCGPEDLGALDVSVPPPVVWFAPRLNRDMLVGVLPPETAWTSSGSYAGLLRLVPLRAGIASSHWGGDVPPAGPSQLTGPSR